VVDQRAPLILLITLPGIVVALLGCLGSEQCRARSWPISTDGEGGRRASDEADRLGVPIR